MPTASNTGTYDVVRLHEAPRPRRRPQLRLEPEGHRADLAVAQVLGVLGRGSPPPDVSWRQVWRRLLLFVIAMSLLLFGSTLGGS